MANRIRIFVNGSPYEIGEDMEADTPLIKFLRNHIGLKGTKYMCKEGACGACIVTLTRIHPISREKLSYAVNSCLTPILACHNSWITTIEGIGNRAIGYNKVQAALAKSAGTQCGFCSPGMVMNMYSLLSSGKDVKMIDVEKSFGGNVCRCTGYRPILDAFKSISSDAAHNLKQKVTDIEDLWKICQNRNGYCEEKYNCQPQALPIDNVYSRPAWHIPNTIESLIELLKTLKNANYFLLAGNTAKGVYKPSVIPDVFIDVNHIPSLKAYEVHDGKLVLGAGMCLTEVAELFYKIGKEKKQFSYLKILADHIQLIANVPVRNVGTIAGNLMIKYEHPEFPSDIFLMLEAVNAKLVTVSNGRCEHPMPVSSLIHKNMDKFLLKQIIIPSLSEEYLIRTFKVMPRAQNVYAYVNAGFLFKLDSNFKVIEKPNIIYGGISSKFVHAVKTEDFFTGKFFLEESTLKKGISILSEEIKPLPEGFKASVEYRHKLAVNLFYKFALGVNSGKINPMYASGSPNLVRPLSSGTQSFETIKERWPLTKPLNKVESIIQCSGEAEYVNDIPECKGQLYGTLVLAEQANALITSIDPSPALQIKGVVAFYSASDIPGKNLFSVRKNRYVPDNEELFCSGKVLYGGQPVGIIVAESEEIAERAAKEVVVNYEPGDPPALTTKQLLNHGKESRLKRYRSIEPKNREFGDSEYTIEGEVKLGSQYHFTMEPQTCVCIPSEDGLNVYPATQWIDHAHTAISRILKIPENSINISLRRLGGGFGSKITRATIVAAACSLAAFKLNRPVKVVLDIETTMKAIGKRNSAYSKYEVGFDGTGLIKWLKIWLYDEMGCSHNDPGVIIAIPGIKNCYESSKWEIQVFSAVTDAPSSSWMRGPGTIEGLASIEEIMERISFILNIDSLEVRLRNFGEGFPLLRKIVSKSLDSSNYYGRKKEIEEFNKNNRWRKKGISLLPMVFHISYFFSLNAMVSIYAEDGTVAVTHGGIEMGQGINTKVIQMCAATLGIDTNTIKIKPTSVMTSPNATLSGASITSDCAIYSVQKCCEILNERLKEIKEKLKDASWEDIISEAYKEDIDLNASFKNRLSDLDLKNYYVNATAVSEVEVDILTGQYQILRADILEDAGESLNPEIDIGQVEGGFVMGLGYFLMERIAHDPDTGLTITDNTAKYWVPGPLDIPIDFRVSLLANAPNPYGVARSKATGEPPICLAMSALFALRNAVISARKDTGLDEWLPFIQPFSVEEACLRANTQEDHLQF